MADLVPFTPLESLVPGKSDTPGATFDRFEEDEESAFDPKKYWFIVTKHLTLVALVATTVLVIAVYWTFSTTPLYSAQTVVLIQQQVPEVLQPKDAIVGEDANLNFFKTQESILKSRKLAAMVIEQQRLASDEAFLGKNLRPLAMQRLGTLAAKYSGLQFLVKVLNLAWSGLRALISAHDAGAGDGSSRLSANGVDSALIDRYLGMLRVSLEEGTSLVDIAFSTPNPQLSERLANAHARAYAQSGVDMRDRANLEAETFLQSRLIELRTQLERSETALNDYRRTHDIIPGLMSVDGKEAVVLDRLKALSQEVTDAELQRIGLEAQVDLIRKRKFDGLPAVQNSPAIQALQTKLNNDNAEIASLGTRFKPEYPPLAELEAGAAKTQDNLEREYQAVVDSINSAYLIALGKEKSLRAEMEKQKQVALQLNDAAVKYAMLQHEVDTNRELTNSALQKMKDLGLEAESEASNVSIVDVAEVPSRPSSPKKAKNLANAGLFGIALALLAAFIREYLAGTLNSPEEVTKYLGLPSLGAVPEFFDEQGRLQMPHQFVPLPPPEAEAPAESVTDGTHSVAIEAYRSIRTGLLLSRAGWPPKVTLFTSGMGGEGKTITAVNTAIMFAHTGARVLVIDADLRRGKCHKAFDIPLSPGLTEFLVGACPAEKLIRSTKVANLSLFPRGAHQPPNSTELVNSGAMQRLLRELSQTYDFVIVDAPPLIPVSDAMILSTMVDGVILVIDAARTPKAQVRLARSRLEYARAKILGFVLNRMHPRHFGYRYYYHEYYDAEDERDVG